MNDLYEVLQVHCRAEPEVIRSAYRTLARKHHPDLGGAPGRMTALNGAWAVLGNQVRRAAYDAEAQAAELAMVAASTLDEATQSQPPIRTGPAHGQGLRARRMQGQQDAGTVLTFGRYIGWTVGSLIEHDPDYLAWLARTQLGRRLNIEIDEALARRDLDAAAIRPRTGAN